MIDAMTFCHDIHDDLTWHCDFLASEWSSACVERSLRFVSRCACHTSQIYGNHPHALSLYLFPFTIILFNALIHRYAAMSER